MNNYKVTLMVTVDASGEAENEAIANAAEQLRTAIESNKNLRFTGISIDPESFEYLVFQTS